MDFLKSAVYSERKRREGPESVKSFKERNSLSERRRAVENIKTKFPNKVPVIVERYDKVM